MLTQKRNLSKLKPTKLQIYEDQTIEEEIVAESNLDNDDAAAREQEKKDEQDHASTR